MENNSHSRFQEFLSKILVWIKPEDIVSNIEPNFLTQFFHKNPYSEVPSIISLQDIESKSENPADFLKINKTKLGVLDISDLTEEQIFNHITLMLQRSISVVVRDRRRTISEYESILQKCNLRNLVIGYSINKGNDDSFENFSFIIEEKNSKTPNAIPIKILCILSVRNEFELILDAIDDVLKKGFDVHVVDNWSDDGTWELITAKYQKNSSVFLEQFPSEPATDFSLKNLLKRCEIIANQSNYDWIVRIDADERLDSCSPDYELGEMIAIADQLGFNVIDFTVLEFRPSEKDLGENTLYPNHGYFTGLSSHQNIQRAWKNSIKRVEFAESGGHEVSGNQKLFPLNQLLRHYSFRNPLQTHRKVFIERIPNYNLKERTSGWHHQYDSFKKSDSMVWKSKSLLKWGRDSLKGNILEISFRSGHFPSLEPQMFSITDSTRTAISYQKKVLLCTANLYSNVPNGGGATYKRLIEANPEVLFYAFSTIREKTKKAPRNYIEVLIDPRDLTEHVLENLLLAVRDSNFDYLDIPDWLTPQESIHLSLRKFNVGVGKIVCALHGSNSRVYQTKPFSFKNMARVIYFRKQEKILYREAEHFYGFSSTYAESLKLGKDFKVLSSLPMCRGGEEFEFPSDLTDIETFKPVFIGRKEYTKGFDKFLDLLDKVDYFEKAVIHAPASFGLDEYMKMFDREIVSLQNIDMSEVGTQEQIMNLAALPNAIFIFPSRFDSFNLSFVQVLVAGGLAACSPNVNARHAANEFGLKFLELSQLKSISSSQELSKISKEIRLSNHEKIAIMRKKGFFDDLKSFSEIYE